MVFVFISQSGVTLQVTEDTTDQWAHTLGRAWPGSELSGKQIYVEFDANGACGFAAWNENGKLLADYSPPAREFDALCADLLTNRLPKDHPAYFAAIGQFSEALNPNIAA